MISHHVPDEDMQGRFGYFLKEHTLETIIQDQYLASRSLHRARIPRDGNCLFRAFAQAIHSDQGFQGIVRQKAVDYLDKNWELLQGYVNMFIQFNPSRINVPQLYVPCFKSCNAPSCKFTDSKGKRYFNICRENSQSFF